MTDYKNMDPKIDMGWWDILVVQMDTIGCHMRRKYEGDPLFIEDGKWYFFDESWTESHGPFETEEEAKKACDKYARDLYGDIAGKML